MADRLKITADRMGQIAGAIRDLANSHVLVGIPQDKARRRKGVIDNASLGYIHERGSPIKHIPARPFLLPGVSGSVDTWSPYLRAAVVAALEGQRGHMTASLRSAGQAAVSAVKRRIRSNIPPPLSPVTIAARRVRLDGVHYRIRARMADDPQFAKRWLGAHPEYKSKYRRKAVSAAQVVALIDTAQLVNSLTYVVERR